MVDEIDEIKLKIRRILKKHKVAKAGIFGSYARGEAKKNSDIDILIEFNGGLLSFVALCIVKLAVGNAPKIFLFGSYKFFN